MEKTKILFDGNCIVCDFEVQHYKRIAPDVFDIQDITHPDFKADVWGLTTAAVNKHLHVITPSNEIKIGVDAFAHIWSRLKNYKWASRVIQWPIIYPVSQVGYEVFASYVRPYLPKKNKA